MCSKKVKRFFGSFLVLAMSFGMCLTAGATSTDPTHDVTGTYGGSTGKPVYSYEYSFGNMEFKYNAASQGTWNANTHQFEGGESEGGWSAVGKSNEITVWNHSNAEVQVRLTFTPAKTGMHFGFGEPSFVLPSAVGTAKDAAPSKTTFVGPMEDCVGLSEGDANVKLGTVTLSVRAS